MAEADVQDPPREGDIETVAAAATWGGPTREQMRRIIATAMLAAYLARLRSLAQAVGADPADVDVADIAVLSAMNATATDQAAGVIATHTAAARAEAVKLLLKGLTVAAAAQAIQEWEQKRREWKTAEVAKTATMTGHNRADDDAVKRNKWDVRRRAVPQRSSDLICKVIVDAGWIPGDGTGTSTLPAHPNCVHTWEYERRLADVAGDAAEVWLGRWVPRQPSGG